jgi:hypothetical protein
MTQRLFTAFECQFIYAFIGGSGFPRKPFGIFVISDQKYAAAAVVFVVVGW